MILFSVLSFLMLMLFHTLPGRQVIINTGITLYERWTHFFHSVLDARKGYVCAVVAFVRSSDHMALAAGRYLFLFVLNMALLGLLISLLTVAVANS